MRVFSILTAASCVLVMGCSDSPDGQDIIKKPELLELSIPSNFPEPAYETGLVRVIPC